MSDECYDSRIDTLIHSQRVGELMVQAVKELVDRSTCHDRSKTLPPEVEVFDEFTPKLKDSTYGSDEYKGFLVAMGDGLKHHYANNRHHPEFHPAGVDGMTLVDMIEMLADWKAATERHADGSLFTSLKIQQDRFGLSDQMVQVLFNTAKHFGWLYAPCGATHVWPDGVVYTCNVPLDGLGWHWGGHVDGSWDGGQGQWWDDMCRSVLADE